jgi:ribonuclease PH
MVSKEPLTIKVRKALVHMPSVEEKRMFSGIAFMVNGKLCVSVSVAKDRIMFRIDPDIHDEAIKRKASRTVIMKGHEYKGYVYVGKEGISSQEDFDYWMELALDFNKKAAVRSKVSERV